MTVEAGTLQLRAANPDLGEAQEDLPCDYDGPDLAVGVNPDYLKDFLGAASTEKVRLELKDENSQCVAYPIDGEDQRYVVVIMPIRL